MAVSDRTVTRGVLAVLVLAIIGIAVGTAVTGVFAQEDSTTEIEPNDAPKGGTPVTAGEIAGRLDPARSDWDWYIVTPEAGETIEASANFETVGNANFVISIVAPNGSSLATNDADERQVGTAAVASEAGTYYIGVKSQYVRDEEASPNNISYTLTATPVMNTTPPAYVGEPNLSAQSQPETEPNDAQAGAMQVQGAPINGTLQPASDEDWFAINATAGQRIEGLAALNERNNTTQLRIELTAPNGTELPFYTVEDFESDKRIEAAAIAPESGTYYVRVYTDYGPPNISYTFTGFAAGEGSAPETTTPLPPPPNGSVEYPPGYGPSGITNASRASNQFASTLARQDSYTAGYGRTIATPSNIDNRTLSTIQFDAAVNATSRRVRTNMSVSNRSGEYRVATYQLGRRSYRLENGPSDTAPQYDTRNLTFNETTTTASFASFEQFFASMDYGNAQLVTRDGDTLIRYDTTLADPGGFFGPSAETDTIENFTGVVLTDQQGLIRQFSYSMNYEASGTPIEQSYEFSVTDLNTTSVSEPGWLAEATANTSLQMPVITTEQETKTPTPTGEPLMTTTDTRTETATPTATPTPTTTEAAATTTAPTNESITGGTTTGTSSSGPGFGIVVGVVGVIAAALLTVRRR